MLELPTTPPVAAAPPPPRPGNTGPAGPADAGGEPVRFAAVLTGTPVPAAPGRAGGPVQGAAAGGNPLPDSILPDPASLPAADVPAVSPGPVLPPAPSDASILAAAPIPGAPPAPAADPAEDPVLAPRSRAPAGTPVPPPTAAKIVLAGAPAAPPPAESATGLAFGTAAANSTEPAAGVPREATVPRPEPPAAARAVEPTALLAAALETPGEAESLSPLRGPMPGAPGSPAWGADLTGRVTWMVNNEVHAAELEMTPPQLGPLKIRIAVHGDHAQVSFTAHHALARDAIDQSIDRLRDALGANGFERVDVDVRQESRGDGAAGDDREAQGGAAGIRTAGEDTGDAPVHRVTRLPAGRVDRYA